MNKCPKHPKYKGLKEPKSCERCHLVWLTNEVKKLNAYIDHIIKFGGAYVGF